jgi:serine/threonine protein kinase
LIGFYGNYTQGHTCNLILEYADQGSLEEYFRKTVPPYEEEDINKFWEGLLGILAALDGIHQDNG